MRLQYRELCHCLARSRVSMGEGRIAHLKKILVQGQDGYSHGVKTQEGNRCVPVEPNTNHCNLQ